MPSPRDNRLKADFQKVRQAVEASGGSLRLLAADGAPPTRYVLEYHCPSLVKDAGGKLSVRAVHQVEIRLGVDYPLPSGKPTARMLTPVFNPHVFESQAICIGGWRPTETLDVLVLRLGALLQWDPKVLDPHSPANHKAMHWALEHRAELPLGRVSFKGEAPAARRIEWE